MRVNKIIFSNNSTIEPNQGVNLIVGGNNTGKSTLIKELGDAIRTGYLSGSTSKWTKQVSLIVENPKKEVSSIFKEVEDGNVSIEDLGNFEHKDFIVGSGFKPNRRNIQPLNQYSAKELSRTATDNSVILDIEYGVSQNQTRDGKSLMRTLLSEVQLSVENCDSRLQEKFEDSIDDILDNYAQDSSSVIRSLIKNPVLLKELRQNIQSVFNIKIGFDDLNQGKRSLRILPVKYPSKKLGEYDRARAWQDCSPLIREQGDGVRAYIKLIFNMLDDFYKIIIIDEPEAFLHPPQRRALGKILAKTAIQNNKQIFVATHDAEFIKGVLIGSKGDKNVSVFRTTIDGGNHTIKQCNLQAVSKYVADRKNIKKVESNRYNEEFLNSLFHKKTILVEDEFDKFFYERYSSLYLNDKALDINYIGLNGKSKIKEVFDQMNELELNVSCIVDIDFLINNNDAPNCIRRKDEELYSIHVAFAQKYNNMKQKEEFRKQLKRDGVESLRTNQDEFRDAKELIDRYAKHGIFIVEVGEIERWYGASKNNANIRTILKKMEDKRCAKLSRFMNKVMS